jgi:hypothetical protein
MTLTTLSSRHQIPSSDSVSQSMEILTIIDKAFGPISLAGSFLTFLYAVKIANRQLNNDVTTRKKEVIIQFDKILFDRMVETQSLFPNFSNFKLNYQSIITRLKIIFSSDSRIMNYIKDRPDVSYFPNNSDFEKFNAEFMLATNSWIESRRKFYGE